MTLYCIGKTWTRLAPHTDIIPLGTKGEFDSHTCKAADSTDCAHFSCANLYSKLCNFAGYAAPPILDPKNPKSTLLYYAGK